jgi:hypothetical protein
MQPLKNELPAHDRPDLLMNGQKIHKQVMAGFLHNTSTPGNSRLRLADTLTGVKVPSMRTVVSDFNVSEGVQLDKDAIRHKPAKRGLAKLCLNSMWGKLTERNNKTNTKLISSAGTVLISLHARDLSGETGVRQRYGGLGLLAINR